MFNGLIALEEAGAANAAAAAADGAAAGGWLAGCRISLRDAIGNQRKWENYPNGRSGGVVSDVRYFVFSSQCCSSSVFSAAPHPSLPTPLPCLHSVAPTTSYLSLGLWSSITWPLSLAPCLENKLIFTPSPLRRLCWLARFVSIDCSICVADLSFFSPSLPYSLPCSLPPPSMPLGDTGSLKCTQGGT